MQLDIKKILKTGAYIVGLLLLGATALWPTNALILKINNEIFGYLVSSFTSIFAIAILVIASLAVMLAALLQIAGSLMGNKKMFSKQAKPIIEFAISKGLPILASLFVFIIILGVVLAVVSLLKVQNLSIAGLLLLSFGLLIFGIEEKINAFFVSRNQKTEQSKTE